MSVEDFLMGFLKVIGIIFKIIFCLLKGAAQYLLVVLLFTLIISSKECIEFLQALYNSLISLF